MNTRSLNEQRADHFVGNSDCGYRLLLCVGDLGHKKNERPKRKKATVNVAFFKAATVLSDNYGGRSSDNHLGRCVVLVTITVTTR